MKITERTISVKQDYYGILRQSILEQFDLDKALEASLVLGYKNPILQDITKDSLKNCLVNALKNYKHDTDKIEHGPFTILKIGPEKIRILFQPTMIEDYTIEEK